MHVASSLQLKEIEIFSWKFATSEARQIFHRLFRLSGAKPQRGFPSEFSDFPQIFYFSSGRFGFRAGKIIFPEIF